MDEQLLDRLLSRVEKPARYTGNEWNMAKKEDYSLRFALCFPDVYEIGMSHLGSRILYNILNKREDTYCERCYAPWVDLEQQLRENDLKLFTLETKTPLDQFDVVGFSLLYEMCYTNILTMLELSSIPFLAKDRDESMPLIVCGGPCACNPEPIADFMDAVMIGDGEELINDLMDCVALSKQKGLTKQETLFELSKIPGVYIPSYYKPHYDENNRFSGLEILKEGAPKRPVRRVVKDLDTAEYIGKPIVPNLSIVHDRAAIELFRGCTRGCRFCQAGFLYRPVRERKQETLLQYARDIIDSTGYDEISLFSLSSGDYSCIHGIVADIFDEFEDKRVSVSLPSLRIDSFLKEDLERMQSVRKASLTFAPEAGSQRLRDVINKGVTEEDLLKSVGDAFRAGWNSVKLYFMIGLPAETDEDILGIADLAQKVVKEYYSIPKEDRAKGLRVTVSASCFVPKPFTPFQWFGQNSHEEFVRKQKLLKDALKRVKGVDFNYHASDLSFLEAVFSRGDRRLSKVLMKAYEKGCRFDSWDECFKKEAWQEAFAECGYNPDDVALRHRDTREPLPWDHIDMLVTKQYLLKELERAEQEIVTRDCRGKCNGCFGENYADYCKI